MERNQQIAAERRAGASLRILAKKYGVTHERIRQIVAKEARIAAARSENHDHPRLVDGCVTVPRG